MGKKDDKPKNPPRRITRRCNACGGTGVINYGQDNQVQGTCGRCHGSGTI